jgi:single-strand DNA-binding protein
MSDIITLTGVVATIPRVITTAEGLAITSFRLASSQRRFDRSQEKWVEGDTNWYTITTFRQLAANTSVSVKKGERLVVTGRLRIREWESGEKRGINIDVEAEAIGHDLTWGTAAFSRNMSSTSVDTSQSQSAPTEGFPTEAELAAVPDDASELMAPGLLEVGHAGAETETPF